MAPCLTSLQVLQLSPDPLLSDGRERDPYSARSQHASISYNLYNTTDCIRAQLGAASAQGGGPEPGETGLRVQSWMTQTVKLVAIGVEKDKGQTILTSSIVPLGADGDETGGRESAGGPPR